MEKFPKMRSMYFITRVMNQTGHTGAPTEDRGRQNTDPLFLGRSTFRKGYPFEMLAAAEMATFQCSPGLVERFSGFGPF